MIGAGSMGALCLALGVAPAEVFVEAETDAEADAEAVGPSLRSVHTSRGRRASGA